MLKRAALLFRQSVELSAHAPILTAAIEYYMELVIMPSDLSLLPKQRERRIRLF